MDLITKTLALPLTLFIFSSLVFGFSLTFYLLKKESRFNLVNLILSIFNTVFAIILTSLYKSQIISSLVGAIIFLVYTIISIIYTLYFLIYHLIYGIRKVIEYNLFTKALGNSKYNTYLVISKKDKIKKISIALLDQLGISLKEALGKKAFELFFKYIRVKHINDREASNKDLLASYQEFKENSAKNAFKNLELNIFNERGEDVFLNLVVQPIYSYLGFYGIIISGEIKSDFDKLRVERKLDVTQSEHKSLEDKFIGFLEVSQDNLVFTDLSEQSTWLSNSLKNELNLPDNTISSDQFRKLICPEDLNTRDQELLMLTPSKPYYKLKYRLFYNNTYTWYQENGKKIFSDNNVALISSLSKINNKHFMASNINELDILPSEHELTYFLSQLFNERAYFNVVYFKINNLKAINEEVGREVGNMLLAQYITKMQNSFKEERTNLFRVSGSEFVLILTDPKKMASLKEGINKRADYLNLVAKFGSLELFADVYAGIAISKRDGNTPKEIITNAKIALGFALDKKYSGQVVYFSN